MKSGAEGKHNKKNASYKMKAGSYPELFALQLPTLTLG